jgi:hypothetical protein
LNPNFLSQKLHGPKNVEPKWLDPNFFELELLGPKWPKLEPTFLCAEIGAGVGNGKADRFGRPPFRPAKKFCDPCPVAAPS